MQECRLRSCQLVSVDCSHAFEQESSPSKKALLLVCAGHHPGTFHCSTTACLEAHLVEMGRLSAERGGLCFDSMDKHAHTAAVIQSGASASSFGFSTLLSLVVSSVSAGPAG